MRKRWHGLVRVLLIDALLAAVLAGVLVAHDAKPAAAATTVYAWTYNLCGGSCHSGGTLPADALIDQVARANPRPLAIAVQEVCSAQHSRLVTQLGAYGYKPARAIAQSPSANCANQSYGNSVFALGTLVNSFRYEFGAQAPGDLSKNPSERRQLVCIRTDVFGPFAACSHHLTNRSEVFSSNRLFRQRQSDESIYVVNANLGDRWRFPGGDFNITPDELYRNTSTRAMDVWYSGYAEAAGRIFSSSGHATTTSGKKIDYIWMDKGHGSQFPLPNGTESSFLFYAGQGISDHALVRGRYSAG